MFFGNVKYPKLLTGHCHQARGKINHSKKHQCIGILRLLGFRE